MRVLFFIFGVPMMILSFFEAIDVLPYVQNLSVIADGKTIELTQEEQESLMQSVNELFENSHTMPAFGVVFDEMFKEQTQNGYFVSMKFPQLMEINDLPFDELVFQVSPDFYGFNLMRGIKGVFQGRCIFINLQNKTMSEFYEKLTNLESVKNASVDESDKQTTEVEENQNENFEVSNEEIPENFQSDEKQVDEEIVKNQNL